MRKLAVLVILVLIVIAYYSNKTFDAQDYQPTSVQDRIQMVESMLKKNHMLFKVLGDNQVQPNGKIVQRIQTNESFEILAMPLIEPVEVTNYPNEFVGKMYTGDGLKLSEVKSDSGIRVKTVLPESEYPKKHSFEFINPNDKPVKVRFYFVQEDKK
ncbi:MAG: hypothetical protein AB1782_12810 [Cyanobacteriota bacterium]